MFLENIVSKDLFCFLRDATSDIKSFADEKSIGSWLLFCAGILLCLFVGLLAFRMIKLVLGLSVACFGWFAAAELYDVINAAHAAPEWLMYVMGAAFAVTLFVLTFERLPYVYVAMSAFSIYCVSAYYCGGNVVASLGLALLLGLLTTFVARVYFILLTSFVSGTVLVSCVAAMIPKLEWLQVGAGNWCFIALAAAVSLVFAIVQFATTGQEE